VKNPITIMPLVIARGFCLINPSLNVYIVKSITKPDTGKHHDPPLTRPDRQATTRPPPIVPVSSARTSERKPEIQPPKQAAFVFILIFQPLNVYKVKIKTTYQEE
jgi:hypothetical protein